MAWRVHIRTVGPMPYEGVRTVAGRGPTRAALLSRARVPVLPPQFRETNASDEWPLCTFLELGALPSAVGCARVHARQVLWEWGFTPFTERVELLVSELLTNAVNASRTLEWITPVRFWLLSDEASVLVLVWDGNPQPPVRIDTSELDEHGRGLLLVEALSDQWDWYVPREIGGKVVTALISKELVGNSSGCEEATKSQDYLLK